ncbi:MAG TPA: hypothetical protein VIN08_02515 [Ohtaekwangia sp.]|uniref:hypothetical protein n=1 Tax=Ohtaekwangia sp. TaxID=2066019 RepID=UPI002F91FC97
MADVAITIRISWGEDEFAQSITEIGISEQDNSIASILLGSELVKYTSIPFSLESIMTDDERGYFAAFLPDDDDDQMQTISAIAPATVAIDFFEKIRTKLSKLCPVYLLQDLGDIDEINQTPEERERSKRGIILDYLNLWDSLSQIVGTLKTADAAKCRVQFIMNYH